MDDDPNEPNAGDVFREFAMACRAERDRVALARLAAEDRRFASATRERAAADSLADLVIAAAARR